MSTRAGVLTEEQVRLLNESWSPFREELAPGTGMIMGPYYPSLEVLSVLAGRREFWELTVSSAGYICRFDPESAFEPHAERAISDTMVSVANRDWGSRLGYEAYVRSVATLDFETIVGAAPSVVHAVQLDKLDIQVFGCLYYCYTTYGKDHKAFTECLERCK